MNFKMTWLAVCCAATTFTYASDDYISGHIGGVSNQFNGDVGNVPGNKYWADLEFDYYKNNPNEIERRVTFATLVNDENLAMYSLQEAYVAKKINEQNNFKFGRQILPWSTVDKNWGFGKLNNRRNFNGFEPGQEGLIGLNYQIRQIGYGARFSIFGSPLYVPESNPTLDINKGDKTITSRTPWADPPASSADAGGNLGSKKIKYIVDYPSINDTIWRYSAGANFAYETKHYEFNTYYMRKPENQISTKVNARYNVQEDAIKAYVKPQFYYHDVYGTDFKYRNLDLEMYVSAIAIRPNSFPDGDTDSTRFTEIKTEKRREDYVGGGISKVNDTYGMGLSYVARLSPFDRVKDTLTVDPRWNQAVDVFFMRVFGPKLKVFTDLKYDMLTTDRMFILRAGYMVSQSMQVNFGISMIGTPTNGKSYWSPYTNNDALYGGLRYVF